MAEWSICSPWPIVQANACNGRQATARASRRVRIFLAGLRIPELADLRNIAAFKKGFLHKLSVMKAQHNGLDRVLP
jgi:hypothetical protein